jgi:CRP-like cAMP-binding protein
MLAKIKKDAQDKMDYNFINYIKSIVDIPIEQENKFCSLISVKKIIKGENFLSEGQSPRTIAFIKSGLFRYYYIDNKGNEFTKGFFDENSVLTSYSAILEKRSSYFTIQALENSEIEIIDYIKSQKLFVEHPCWNSFLVVQLQKALIMKEEREREFLLFDAEQRYRAFLQQFPNLEKRIKQNIIASYLRLAPESLSRIRKKTAN